MGLTYRQHVVLARPLNGSRVAKRSQAGQDLAYLESWDVRAHLIRIFGYTNFDVELLDYHHVTTREYLSKGDPNRNIDPKPMVEVIYAARVRLTIRSSTGYELCTYVEGACGSASGNATMLGEFHDNALKTAESDALKRCAINLGNQFGLSLYDHGSTSDVIKGTLVMPEAPDEPEGPEQGQDEALTDDQKQALADSLGAVVVAEEAVETPEGEAGQDEHGAGEEPSPPPVAPDATQAEHLGDVLSGRL